MSHLNFKAYAGIGERQSEMYHYSQSVRVGDQVYISGQGRLPRGSFCLPTFALPPLTLFSLLPLFFCSVGGWYSNKPEMTFPSDLDEEIDQAFQNIQIALKDCGAKMDQVFKVRLLLLRRFSLARY